MYGRKSEQEESQCKDGAENSQLRGKIEKGRNISILYIKGPAVMIASGEDTTLSVSQIAFI
jgi:hypothetical protein